MGDLAVGSQARLMSQAMRKDHAGNYAGKIGLHVIFLKPVYATERSASP